MTSGAAHGLVAFATLDVLHALQSAGRLEGGDKLSGWWFGGPRLGLRWQGPECRAAVSGVQGSGHGFRV